MIHTFGCLGKFYLLDVESGSFFCVDREAFDIVKATPLKDGEFFAHESGAAAELNKLIAEGVLNTAAKKTSFFRNTGVLKSLCLNVSHDCNLNCAYCFANESVLERRNMSSQTAAQAVDMLIENSGTRKVLEIDFFGGEPTLNYQVVKDTVEYAKKRAAECGKAFRFTVTTNAVSLTDEQIDFFNREMYNAVISIDGRESVHNFARKTRGGQGSFDAAIKNAHRFVDGRQGKDYYIRGTFTAKNIDFASDAVFLHQNGFNNISLEPVILPNEHPLALKAEHIAEIERQYELLAEYVKKTRKGENPLNFFHFNINLSGGPCLTKRLTACGAATEYLAVTPDGSVYPCHQFAGQKLFRLGSVESKAVPRGETVDMFASSSVLSKSDCQKCFARYYCGGGCAANAINNEGGISCTNALSCALIRKRTECALALEAARALDD